MIKYTLYLASDDEEHILIASEPLTSDTICARLNVLAEEVIGIDVEKEDIA